MEARLNGIHPELPERCRPTGQRLDVANWGRRAFRPKWTLDVGSFPIFRSSSLGVGNPHEPHHPSQRKQPHHEHHHQYCQHAQLQKLPPVTDPAQLDDRPETPLEIPPGKGGHHPLEKRPSAKGIIPRPGNSFGAVPFRLQEISGLARAFACAVMTKIDRRTFSLSCLAVLIAGCARQVRGWPRGYVSLTYDDGLSSQLDIAAPQLEKAGLRGTFYLTWNNMKDRAVEWAALAGRGHELANHSVTHPCDLRHQDLQSFRAREIDPMQRWLGEVEGAKRARDYAYPCDVTDLGPGNPDQQADTYARVLRSARILRARTSEGPPNSLRWVQDAPYRLQALALRYDAKNLTNIRDYLSEAVKEGRWAILVMHEIGSGRLSDGSISPGEHERLLETITQMHVPCGTVQSAISYARIREA